MEGFKNRTKVLEESKNVAPVAEKAYKTMRTASNAFNELCKYPSHIEKGY